MGLGASRNCFAGSNGCDGDVVVFRHDVEVGQVRLMMCLLLLRLVEWWDDFGVAFEAFQNHTCLAELSKWLFCYLSRNDP